MSLVHREERGITMLSERGCVRRTSRSTFSFIEFRELLRLTLRAQPRSYRFRKYSKNA